MTHTIASSFGDSVCANALLVMPIGMLLVPAITLLFPAARAAIQETGPHGLSELLYAYASVTGRTADGGTVEIRPVDGRGPDADEDLICRRGRAVDLGQMHDLGRTVALADSSLHHSPLLTDRRSAARVQVRAPTRTSVGSVSASASRG